MNAKPLYVDHRYEYSSDVLDLDKNLNDLNLQMKFDRKLGVQRRFKGYMYRNSIYMDNPGPQCSVDAETRAHWLKKRWI